MKTQYQIQISRIDNGFLIAARGDEQGEAQRRLQAPDEAGVKELLHKIIDDSIFVDGSQQEKPKTQPKLGEKQHG